MSEPGKSLHQRLAAAMLRVDYIQKEKKAGMRYSIVSHDAVTAKVRPVLLDEGILYYPRDLTHSQNGNRTEVALTVRFVNVDDASDLIDVPSLGYGIDDQDKGPGKAISYAVKYALLKALGLETGDDPDTDQEAVHRPAQRPTQPISNLGGTEALKATLRASIAAETPHDPETGEVIDREDYGTPTAWMMGASDKLGFKKPLKELNGHEQRMVNQEYAAMLIARAAKFKPHKGALVFINQFEQTHAAKIDKLDGDLRSLVRDALAEARDRATNPDHDPRAFRDAGTDAFGLPPVNDHHEFR